MKHTHQLVAGAVFDVAGYLAIVYHPHNKAAQHEMAAHIMAWAKARGLELQNADIQNWTNFL